VSIALHEVGHLLPAKLFKVRVTKYMIGFGPTLWSRKKGETEYGFKAIPLDRIDVVVHPQSVVHSMVQFVDGSIIAQASPPDMRLPIALGLGWPDRVPKAATPCDWTQATSWTFEPLDAEAFPAVGLAKDAARQGSTYPAVFNAANEEAVMAFHAGRIRFTDIVDTIEAVLSEHTGSSGLTVESVLDAERWARARTHERLAVRSV